VIKVDTPNGEAFYRYNHDGYGEMNDGRRWNWDGKYTGRGRLWALLSGERGQFEIAECGSRNADPRRNGAGQSLCLENARRRLDSVLGFANDGLMIPEQIWDMKEAPAVDEQFIPPLAFGEGTGSATPLAWSMAQFIRLAANLKAGRNLDTPDIVYRRYVSPGNKTR
jgi:glucoamylase